MASAESGSVRVEVACSPAAGQVLRCHLVLDMGATVREAISQSGLPWPVETDGIRSSKVGVWGQLRPLDQVLRDGDRVEIYRDLLIDPKDARRVRHRGQSKSKR